MQQPISIQDDVSEAPPPATSRDIQRAALHDLVALATESVAAESQIERTHRFDFEAERSRNDRFVPDLKRKYANLHDAARQNRDHAVQSIESWLQGEIEQMKARDEENRRKLQIRHETTAQEIKKQHDHEVWLAESVLENEENGAAVELKKAKDVVEDQRKLLADLGGQAEALLKAYKTRPIEPTEKDLEAHKAVQILLHKASEIYQAELAAAEQHLAALHRLRLPKLFVGATPYLAAFGLLALAGLAPRIVLRNPGWTIYAAAVGAVGVITLVAGVLLRNLARKYVRQAHVPLRDALAIAHRATEGEIQLAGDIRQRRLHIAHKRRDAEVLAVQTKYEPLLLEAQRVHDAAIESLQLDFDARLAELAAARDKAVQEADDVQRAGLDEVARKFERDLGRAADQHAMKMQLIEQRYRDARQALASRLHTGLEKIQMPGSAGADAPVDWNDPAWLNFTPPTVFPEHVRFGEMTVDLGQIAAAGIAPKAPALAFGSNVTTPTGNGDGDGNADGDGDAARSSSNGAGSSSESAPSQPAPLSLKLPPAFAVPASLVYPRLGSLLIQTDREGRAQAIRAMQTVMARLLTAIPPGRVRFIIIDPIGRGENFAGFMHLADHDDALIGGRIWTEREQIEQRLADMTEHMETVIQKYLRNEYDTIDAYNAQAGELAEPYRVLVISDFPTGFEGDAARRLASVASSGPRCGVYTLILRDMRQELPAGAHLDEVERNSINLVRVDDKFILREPVFEQFPLTLDPPPPEHVLTGILDIVGQAAKAAKRVELPFDSIAPHNGQFWSQSSASELAVPVGRSGATKLQYIRLGRGVAQHLLIAGKTGSGKSTLLHAMITNLAMWYSPDEVEFYLVDFKKGVEFKTYATHGLPHARAIAVESDREFGLSVLQRLDAELTRRGNLYRVAGTQDLAAYRKSPGAQRMPRTLLIIDEFQEFFSEDDKLAQDATLLLDRLVRQGRAFGIHVLLGSQTIGGSSGLPRSTIGQMAVRIALQTSDADSQLILGDNNSAARLLSRPGEAIYNDAGGLPENNSPFQVAWLPDPRREEYLDKVYHMAAQAKVLGRDPMIVFEGNAAADAQMNVRLMSLLDAPTWPPAAPVTIAYLGDPVAIKEPTSVTFRRQSGSNVLIVGQQDEAAMALMCVSVISIAAQQAPKNAIIYILDGTPADSSLVGVFGRVKDALPNDINVIEYRHVPETIDRIAQELTKRQAGAEGDSPSIFVFIYGLQRYRMLRKTEESFSFAAPDAEKPPEPDKQFAAILREGPAFGVHVISWADTPATLERTLDRAALREFDNRILFQMSANDSSNLIDSPTGNKLGQNRALIYSEEQGVMEKFRPYAIPDAALLRIVRARFAVKTGPQ